MSLTLSSPLRGDAHEGRVLVGALEIAAGEIRMDGSLDEPAWQRAAPVSGFVQKEPEPGRDATERTEVRVLYDRENLYIGAILHDANPDGIIADEMRRDSDLERNDAFAVLIDTYHDHRNGFFFETNPLGARTDALVFNEGESVNYDWDGVWWSEARRVPTGWQVEMKIPFSTLRFDEKRLETWGLQFRRIIRGKNEQVYWAFVPRDADMWRLSLAGHLEGLREIRQGRNISVKPFILAGVKRLPSEGKGGTESTKDAGVDIKYSITPNLTANLAVNPDFAQVEADELPINISRFPVFFPEKREFFLEGSGFFDFGLRAKLQPFFSRRIGLAAGENIPITAGGKLTGKIGDYGIGLLAMQTKEKFGEPRTNYSVLRLKKDILSRSSIGVIAVNKGPEEGPSNRTAGADINLSLFDYLYINSFLVKAGNEGTSGKDTAGYARVGWRDPSKYLNFTYLDVKDQFNPEVGFAMRTGIKESTLYGERFLRPVESRVREYSLYALLKHVADQENNMAGRNQNLGFSATFHSGDRLDIAYQREFDRLDFDFNIRPGIVIPKGGYATDSINLVASTDASRQVSGNLSVTAGKYYNGRSTSYNGSLNWRPSKYLKISPGFTRQEVSLPAGSFEANLINALIEYPVSTKAFMNALLQWNDDLKKSSLNLRFNYGYRPGSDIYLVYNEQRDMGGGFTDRALFLKFTYLWGL